MMGKVEAKAKVQARISELNLNLLSLSKDGAS
jgi:hypothetical protein